MGLRPLFLAFVAFLSIPAAVSTAADPASWRPGEILLQFRSDASPAAREAVLRDLGAVDVRPLKGIPGDAARITRGTVEDAVARYGGDPLIRFIEPNFLYRALEVPNDPSFGLLWGLRNTGQNGGTPGADINATSAWDVTTGSNQVLVAIIDTGVDYNHPDLAANIFVNPGEIPANGLDDDGNGFVDDVHGWDFVNNDNNPIDDHFHGTHVAGTIGAVGDNGIGVAGVNWTVRILPLKFLDAGGYGSTEDAVAAIYYATQIGARILNNSWGGGPYSEALKQAIENADQNGALFVAAAGNSAENNDLVPQYPASYDVPNIIVVAATDRHDALADFSNYGATSVDLAAPGVEILSTFPGNSYGYLDGTSMAAPHVSGALALMLGRFPGITAPDAKALLLSSVDPLPSLLGKVATGGRLDAFTPIAEPDSIPPDPVVDLAASDANGSRVTLTWSATGDDGSSGPASRYEVRYATFPIDASNFQNAVKAGGEPDPQDPGTLEQMTVNGLTFSTPYFFAVKVFDEHGNASALSNVAGATTLGPPNLVVSPDSVSADLLTGATATATLYAQNTGEGECLFTTGVTQGAAAEALRRLRARLHEDSRAAEPLVEPAPASPVPYSDGYVSRSAPISVPARTPGTAGGGLDVLILQSGGSVTEIRNLLLAFPDIATVDVFNGQSASPTLDALLSYDAVLVAMDNSLNDPVVTGNVLADYVDAGGGVVLTLASFITGWAIEGRFQTDGYSPYNPGTGPVGSSTLGNFDTGHPIMAGVTQASGDLLGSMSLASGAELVASWSNNLPFVAVKGAGVVGVNIFVATSGAWGGDIPLILRNAAFWSSHFASWLSVAPEEGVIPAGGTLPIEVTFNAEGLTGGEYFGAVSIESNDPDGPVRTIPARLHVTGAPDISATPASVSFGSVFIGSAAARKIVVSNEGTDLLTVSGVVVDDPDFQVDGSGFTLTPGDDREIQITLAPSRSGPITGSLVLSSDDPDESVLTVPLDGEGLVPPDVGAAPDSLAADLFTGSTATATFTITNTGGSDLDFSLGTRGRGGLLAVAPNAGGRLPGVIGFSTRVRPEAGRGSGASIAATSGPSGMLPVLARRMASLSPRFPVFYDDMENGTNGWTTQVFVVDDLWHRTGRSFNSPSTSWWCGDENSGNYSTGRHIHTAAVSPPIDLHNVLAPITLEFYENYNTEPDWDHCMVDVSADGGTNWTPLRGGLGQAPTGTSNGWILSVLDLSAYAEQVIQVRFNFDTVDDVGNDYPGWFFDDVLVAGAGVPWLALAPDQGRVPAGTSVDVQVTFDAAGLFGGDYDAFIVLSSNDPDEGELLIPAHLHVTGAPDIEVSAPQIDFGPVYTGFAGAETLVVRNVGTDILTLTETTIAGPGFSGPSGIIYVIPPGESRDFALTFAPVASGPAAGTLTIACDDPDEPQVVVLLAGEGVVPPDITVSPDSLSADLFTNETADRTLTIGNSSGSDLAWSLRLLSETTSLRTHASVRRPPVSAGSREARVRGGLPSRPHGAGTETPSAEETAGPAVPFETAAGAPGALDAFTFKDDFEDGNFDGWQVSGSTVGKEVTAATGAAGTTHSFHRFDASGGHFEGIYRYFGAVQPGYIGFWIRTGSEGTNSAYCVFRNSTADEVLWFFAREDGHLYINENVGGDASFPYAPYTWYRIELRNVDFTAKTFDYYVDGNLIKESIPFRNASFTQDVYRLDLYNYTNGSEAWWDQFVIADEPPLDWLAAEPLEGVVHAGETALVTVHFDAKGLYGGDYRGSLTIDSNDPDENPVVVPVRLGVTGVQDVAVSADSLDFGAVLIGATAAETLVVSNVGTDILLISGVTSSSADYSVDPASFGLAPATEQEVVVSFHPGSVGAVPATLTIASNDPDESTLTVALEGIGAVPADIAVSPDSFQVVVEEGGSATRTLSIENKGGVGLEFRLGSLPKAALSAAPPGRYIVFHDDMEQGTNGWTKQIFGADDLWHQTTRNFHSPGKSWWCGVESQGNYATGYRVNTAVVSPVIDLRGLQSPITLEFQENYNTEYNWDFCMVDLAPAGGQNWTPLRGGLGLAPSGSSGGWKPAVLDLSPFAGQLVQIRFYFDTIDAGGNAFPGWFFDDVQVTASGVPWIVFDPRSGEVAPGQKTGVLVTFDAGDLKAGNHDAEIVVSSNDPDAPEVLVPTRLHVIGIPDIALSRASIDFGAVYTGYDRAETLNVSNTGTDVLNVGGITANGAGFSVSGADAFPLDPGESRAVAIVFTPEASGPATGSVSVASNDPDEPLLSVSLSGEGVIPPDLGVSPDSLSVRLILDHGATRALTLRNTGGSPLTFHVSAREGTPSAGPGEIARQAFGKRSATRPRAAGHEAIVPPPLRSGPSGVYATLEKRLLALPPRVPVFYDDMEGTGEGWTRQVFETDDLWHRTALAFNSPTRSLWCGIEEQGNYATGRRIHTAAVTPVIDLHDLLLPITLEFWENYETEKDWDYCMVDVSSDGIAWTPLRGGLNEAPSGSSNGWKLTLFDLSAWAEKSIRIRFHFDTTDPGANAYPGWFVDDVLVTAASVPWLSLDPSLGSVPAGGELDVQVGIDATGLATGRYRADIAIQSNDPGQPRFVVPLDLEVTGPPAIALSPAALDFGTVFAGASAAETVFVSNTGTGPLEVTGVVSDMPAFAASPGSFLVDVGGEVPVLVTFHPPAAGAYGGTLSFLSNDPAHGNLPLPVAGTGILSAEFRVQPSKLNLASRGGWVSGTIELPPGVGPGSIDVGGVRLDGSVPPRSDYAHTGDADHDGIPDLTLQFERRAVQETLPDADQADLVVTGQAAGAAFSGTARIDLIRHHVTSPNGGEVVAGGVTFPVTWNLPPGWAPDHADIAYSLDGGGTWSVAATGFRGERYLWPAPASPTSRARVRVTLFDAVGRIASDASDADFTIAGAQAAAGDGSAPGTLVLRQNAPNPFNPVTRIAFDLPRPGVVRLTIHDMAGRRLRVLVDRWLPAGSHEVTWGGDDEAGRTLASGMYVYRLQAAGDVRTRRMVLMK